MMLIRLNNKFVKKPLVEHEVRGKEWWGCGLISLNTIHLHHAYTCANTHTHTHMHAHAYRHTVPDTTVMY